MKTIKLSHQIYYDSSTARTGDTLAIKFKGTETTLIYGVDKFWRDEQGSIYGFVDTHDVGDTVIRCGVGYMSLPASDPLTDACRPHDYVYSCPLYQASNDRSAADKLLKAHIEIIGRGSWRGFLAKPFYWAVRVFGGFFWENPKTR